MDELCHQVQDPAVPLTGLEEKESARSQTVSVHIVLDNIVAGVLPSTVSGLPTR